MPFQSAPAIAEAVIKFTGVGAEMNNVIHFTHFTGYDQTNISDLADDVDAAIADNYLPYVAIGLTYVETTVRGLENAVDLTASANASAGAGTASGALTLPFNVAFCITLRSAFTGRSARGRFYAVPTSAENLVSDNTFTSAYVSGIQAGLENILASAESDGWFPVILSRRNAGALRPVGIGYQITDVVARNNISDSQRGRLPADH